MTFLSSAVREMGFLLSTIKRRWRVGIAHPEEPDEFLCTLRADPGAISSSGAYERFVRVGTSYYGHVIDPRTGRPARGAKGVTVWTESAVLGDVLSTALCILGASALREGGGLEELARRWAPPGGSGRFSALVVENDPTVWGGLTTREVHRGAPAFRVSEARGVE